MIELAIWFDSWWPWAPGGLPAGLLLIMIVLVAMAFWPRSEGGPENN